MNFPGAHVLNCKQQFFLNGLVMSDLVLRDMNHHNTDTKLCDVLLELQTAVDR